MRVPVQDKGVDVVPVGSACARAHHFTTSSGLNRDVWFDRNNRLVRVRFAAKDGSKIVYQLR